MFLDERKQFCITLQHTNIAEREGEGGRCCMQCGFVMAVCRWRLSLVMQNSFRPPSRFVVLRQFAWQWAFYAILDCASGGEGLDRHTRAHVEFVFAHRVFCRDAIAVQHCKILFDPTRSPPGLRNASRWFYEDVD